MNLTKAAATFLVYFVIKAQKICTSFSPEALTLQRVTTGGAANTDLHQETGWTAVKYLYLPAEMASEAET